jgi:hypothetical protein
MPKVYPLKVERWGEEGEIILSRGHHPPCSFLRRAVRLVHREPLGFGDDDWREVFADLFESAHHPHDTVNWEWWRHSVSRDMGEGTEWEGMRYYTPVAGPGPGVFPVTVVRLW